VVRRRPLNALSPSGLDPSESPPLPGAFDGG